MPHIAGKETAFDKLSTIEEHSHEIALTAPALADGITVTSSATAWQLGAAVTLIGMVKNLSNAATSNPAGTVTRVQLTGHGFEIGNNVVITGMADVTGTWEILDVSDQDHFDFDAGTYTAQTPPGDATEQAQEEVSEDFDIHYVSIEDLSANGTYRLELYADGVFAGAVRFTKNAVQDGTVNAPEQTFMLSKTSVITAKLASSNAAGDAADIALMYHKY